MQALVHDFVWPAGFAANIDFCCRISIWYCVAQLFSAHPFPFCMSVGCVSNLLRRLLVWKVCLLFPRIIDSCSNLLTYLDNITWSVLFGAWVVWLFPQHFGLIKSCQCRSLLGYLLLDCTSAPYVEDSALASWFQTRRAAVAASSRCGDREIQVFGCSSTTGVAWRVAAAPAIQLEDSF